MKKLFLVATFVVAGFVGAYAQPTEGFSFGAGIRLGLPIGDFADFSSFGVGGELQGEYGFSDMVSGILTTGYTSFFGKDYDIPGGGTIKGESTGYIPILAGIRVYPSTNFFIGAQAGYGILTGGGDSEGAFNYQPQIGYNGEKFQLALNYNGLSKDGSTLSHIGLTGIFKFGGGQ
ncbi:MAG: hypothetical protein ACXWWD_07300 [Chitinophagaceae bacterium]